MVKKEVLRLAENAIREQLGTLDDIPYELANTVANIYYSFCALASEVKDKPKEGWILTAIKKTGNLKHDLADFIDDYARIEADIRSAPKFIEGLRAIDKSTQPNLYQYTVDFILDSLKYNIPNVIKKTGIRRKIERVFRKKYVKEIPNLVDLMDI